MNVILAIVWTVITFLAIFGASAFFGYTIMKPLTRATKGKELILRLCVADFFALTLLLVVPTLIVSKFRDFPARVHIVILVAVVCLSYSLFIWAWVRGSMKLSTIGVNDSFKRFVFLGIVLPVAITGTALVVPLLTVRCSMFMYRPDTELPVNAITSLVLTPLCAIAGHLITRWIVRQGPAQLDDVAESVEA